MTKSEEEYYKKLFGQYYNDLYRNKLLLSQKDKDRISKRLKKLYSKKEYWLNREINIGSCCSCSRVDWCTLKYAEAKRQEYDNEIEVNEFYLC